MPFRNSFVPVSHGSGPSLSFAVIYIERTGAKVALFNRQLTLDYVFHPLGMAGGVWLSRTCAQ